MLIDRNPFQGEDKFKEAITFYDPLFHKDYYKVLDVSAIVLANLCVCYAMTKRREDAEKIMRLVEDAEEQLGPDAGGQQKPCEQSKSLHSCIIDLAIGPLYCSKSNYEFGISMIIKALQPYPRKLSADTWHYAKRCFLSLMENMSRQVVILRDSSIEECLQFLNNCELHGKTIRAVEESPLSPLDIESGKNTVTYEARLLKYLFLSILQ